MAAYIQENAAELQRGDDATSIEMVTINDDSNEENTISCRPYLVDNQGNCNQSMPSGVERPLPVSGLQSSYIYSRSSNKKSFFLLNQDSETENISDSSIRCIENTSIGDQTRAGAEKKFVQTFLAYVENVLYTCESLRDIIKNIDSTFSKLRRLRKMTLMFQDQIDIYYRLVGVSLQFSAYSLELLYGTAKLMNINEIVSTSLTVMQDDIRQLLDIFTKLETMSKNLSHECRDVCKYYDQFSLSDHMKSNTESDKNVYRIQNETVSILRKACHLLSNLDIKPLLAKEVQEQLKQCQPMEHAVSGTQTLPKDIQIEENDVPMTQQSPTDNSQADVSKYVSKPEESVPPLASELLKNIDIRTNDFQITLQDLLQDECRSATKTQLTITDLLHVDKSSSVNASLTIKDILRNEKQSAVETKLSLDDFFKHGKNGTNNPKKSLTGHSTCWEKFFTDFHQPQSNSFLYVSNTSGSTEQLGEQSRSLKETSTESQKFLHTGLQYKTHQTGSQLQDLLPFQKMEDHRVYHSK
ncbi:uncharacterized protein [Periplaneta americana]|uniref:uncharacterized protein n=1 Tax=Periplaneta americana TaxID=6978 RepID=UPI0037E9B224